MVKKFLLVIVVLVLGVWWVKWRGEDRKLLLSPTPTPEVIYKKVDQYAYEVEKVSAEKIKLMVNRERLDSERLIETNKCKKAINGGFYDEGGEPLGLVIVEGEEVSKRIKSSLFNGFFWVGDNGLPGVGYGLSNGKLRVALQSGPVLMNEGGVVDLGLVDDKQARRMALGVSGRNEVVFMAVFDSQAVTLGPLLDELPSLIEEINKKEGLGLRDVLNLDGGRASAFYSENLSLSEVTWVGSLLCGQ